MGLAHKSPSLGREGRLAILALLILPFLLLLIDPQWLYTGISKRDSWSYHAYFLDLPGHLRLHPNDYPGSRLTIVLPGWLAYRLLPPGLADPVLHLLVYYAVVLGLYWTLLRTVGLRVALLMSVLVGLHGFVLFGTSSNYIDGFGPAYFLLATAALAEASEPGARHLWLVAAGMAMAALVVANLVFVLLIPGLVAFFVVRNWVGMRRSLLAAAVLVCGGALVLLVALALANKGLGGRYLFLSSSFTFTQNWFASYAVHPAKLAAREWLPQAGYLVLPLTALVGGAVWLFTRGKGAAGIPGSSTLRAVAIFFQVQLFVLAVVLAGLQWVPSFSLMQWWFYPIALLLPAAALALAAQWQGLLENLSPRSWFGLLLLTLGLGLLAHGMVRDSQTLPIALCAVIACIGGVVAVLGRGWILAGVALGTLFLADWGVHCQFDPTGNLPSQEMALFRGLGARAYDSQRKNVFRGIDEAMRLMNQENAGQRCWVWFDNEEPLTEVFDRTACLHMCTTLLHRKIEPGAAQPWWWGGSLPPGCRIAVLSGQPSRHEEVMPQLARYRLAVRVLQHKRVGRGLPSFYLTILKTEPLGEQTARREP